jgi:hypothetical protein
MVLRIVLSIVLAAVAFALGGPVLYYFWVAPQSAAALALAKESDDEITRIAETKTFSQEDYRASMQRTRDREARYQQILAEKRRKRTRTWQIAIVSGIATSAAAFGALTLISKRRRIHTTPTEPRVERE